MSRPVVTPVVRRRGYYVFACGGARAEVARLNGRLWRWRVWHAIGDGTICSGKASGKRTGVEVALAILVNYGG